MVNHAARTTLAALLGTFVVVARPVLAQDVEASTDAPADGPEPALPGPRLRSSAVMSHESLGATRIAPRLTIEVALAQAWRLTAGGGTTHVFAADQRVGYGIAGAQIEWRPDPVTLRAWGAAIPQHEALGLSYDAAVHAALHAVEWLGLSLEARRRPFLEGAPPLATDSQVYYRPGAGGATALLVASRLSVLEASLGLNLAPLRGGYLYAQGTGFEVSDNNRGYSLAAGLGYDLVAAVTAHAPVSVVLAWNSFLTGFEHASGTYFSPARFDVHDVGGELRWRPTPSFELFGGGAMAFSLTRSGEIGHLVSIGARLDADPVALELRARLRDEVAFRSEVVWLAIEGRL